MTNNNEKANLLSVGEFARQIGASMQSLRNWDKSGKLTPAHVSASGYRYYTEDQVFDFLASKLETKRELTGQVQAEAITKAVESGYFEAYGVEVREISENMRKIYLPFKAVSEIFVVVDEFNKDENGVWTRNAENSKVTETNSAFSPERMTVFALDGQALVTYTRN